MGKAALDGQTGVVSVTNGWHKMREINRVVYDSQTIRLKRLEEILKKSGTYIRTISVQEATNDR